MALEAVAVIAVSRYVNPMMAVDASKKPVVAQKAETAVKEKGHVTADAVKIGIRLRRHGLEATSHQIPADVKRNNIY